jgi:hypothetical protein
MRLESGCPAVKRQRSIHERLGGFQARRRFQYIRRQLRSDVRR